MSNKQGISKSSKHAFQNYVKLQKKKSKRKGSNQELEPNYFPFARFMV